ncbi:MULTISPECIES: helix-turn-helix domain-containing protein [Clostridium]|uniref:Helix-turn-helix domain protein n=2 Tax=Clostridium TaxID=1485 RepID=A0A151ARY3_9CLOT|nr:MULTISPECIES: helix-turn-helix transcriptional regulator [Clostridium]KYH30399.1 helix-turn-helix domain protein [Clostridium colicanis DSM 13634]PRR76476.1 Helix-turn-helix domain protein [Clostridium thermopalmarium DSM 5974]PVZ28411.1 helix-turn-helix protein [Clostridium thermopalmarium DSM 5974]
MEVLSVGEKIKRARIYKGLTLKDICGDKISVSKLSCIENDKVVPEEWILDYIASKLELNPNYLKLGIEDQINENLKELVVNPNCDDYEEKLKYNLGLAQKHGYYDLAFYIMHLIFEYLLDNNELSKTQELLGTYYDLCNNSDSNNRMIYYIDIAKFFFNNGEIVQASNYFENVRKTLDAEKSKDYSMYVESIYGEVRCKIILKEYSEAYNVAVKLKKMFSYMEDDLKKAKIYHMMAILSLRMGNEEFKEYELKSYKIYDSRNDYKCEDMLDYASIMFEMNEKDKAIEYINKSLNMYPTNDKEKQVRFMLLCIEELINNGALSEAESLIEKVIDYSINLNNIKFIEKSYYLKSKILQNNSNYISAEMYMNLSLDALTKFGNNKEIYDRYMEMGKMYFDMNYPKDALKYFALAINLQEKL